MELRARGLITLSSNPGNFSEALWHLIAGMIGSHGDIRVPAVCVHPERTGVLKYLMLMGAPIRMENHRWVGEDPVVDFHSLPPKKLFPVRVQPGDMSFLISDLPALFMAIACADGTSMIPYAPASEPMINFLTGLGISIERDNDTLKIIGQPSVAALNHLNQAKDLSHV
jgi:5-enolpyruvylshikimate-3-phosphate synthase